MGVDELGRGRFCAARQLGIIDPNGTRLEEILDTATEYGRDFFENADGDVSVSGLDLGNCLSSDARTRREVALRESSLGSLEDDIVPQILHRGRV